MIRVNFYLNICIMILSDIQKKTETTENFRNSKTVRKMKTRMITSTMVVLFATATLVSATTSRTENPSSASSHENVICQTLESWTSSRDNWEQEGQELTAATVSENSFLLNEWMEARDNWEKEGQGLAIAPAAEKSISLEEWIAGMESWEQEGVETNFTFTLEYTAGMEEWIAEIADWEQK